MIEGSAMKKIIRRLVRSLHLILVLLAIPHGGCFVGPVGQYQVPESIGKGNVQVGIAGGGAIRADVELGLGDRPWGITSDVWLDVGVGERHDLRFRLSNLMILDFRPGEDNPSFDILSFNFQYKRSSSSGDSAFIVGIQPHLIIDVVRDHTDVDFGAPLVYIGGVFGFGERGGIRYLFTPTFAGGFGGVMFGAEIFWFQLAASFGLEIPVSDSVVLRPELAIHFAPVIVGDHGGAIVMGTLGMGLAF